jgi:hypothetical protein
MRLQKNHLTTVSAIILERYRQKVTIFAVVYLRARVTFSYVVSRQQRYQLFVSNIASASGAQSWTVFSLPPFS